MNERPTLDYESANGKPTIRWLVAKAILLVVAAGAFFADSLIRADSFIGERLFAHHRWLLSLGLIAMYAIIAASFVISLRFSRREKN